MDPIGVLLSPPPSMHTDLPTFSAPLPTPDTPPPPLPASPPAHTQAPPAIRPHRVPLIPSSTLKTLRTRRCSTRPTHTRTPTPTFTP